MGCTKETRMCTWGKIAPLESCCIEHLKALAQYTHNLFQEYAIPYWIDFGSLLGMYREKGIIVHDTDVDLGVEVKYNNKISSLAARIEADGYLLDSSNSEFVQRIYVSKKNQLHLDIFLYQKNGHILESRFKAAHDFLYEYIAPLGKIECWGHEFFAPNDITRFLAMRYGPDYMTPRKHYKGPVRRETHDGEDLI